MTEIYLHNVARMADYIHTHLRVIAVQDSHNPIVNVSVAPCALERQGGVGSVQASAMRAGAAGIDLVQDLLFAYHP